MILEDRTLIIPILPLRATGLREAQELVQGDTTKQAVEMTLGLSTELRP